MSILIVIGLYSVQFDGCHSAQSAASVFQFLGFIISLIFSLRTCTNIKLYAHLVITIISLLAFMVLTGKNNYEEMKSPEKKVNDEPILSPLPSIQLESGLNTKL